MFEFATQVSVSVGYGNDHVSIWIMEPEWSTIIQLALNIWRNILLSRIKISIKVSDYDNKYGPAAIHNFSSCRACMFFGDNGSAYHIFISFSVEDWIGMDMPLF